MPGTDIRFISLLQHIPRALRTETRISETMEMLAALAAVSGASVGSRRSGQLIASTVALMTVTKSMQGGPNVTRRCAPGGTDD